jgi:tRNA-Thr(GGU) m(6)t(6)A37 methyltransferase TsaA
VEIVSALNAVTNNRIGAGLPVRKNAAQNVTARCFGKARRITRKSSRPKPGAKVMNKIEFQPIGFIHSPFNEQKGTPIQPKRDKGTKGYIEIFPEYKDGLDDLDGFSHIILLYHLHLSKDYSLKVVPYLDTVPRGLFATRAPRRPNPIGLSVVRLDWIEGTTIHISNLDIIDGTPLLDIKPYVPHFDDSQDIRIGWLTGKSVRAKETDADNRFVDRD